MDYLPRTVPKTDGGQYFDVEYYLLNSPRHTALKDKFSSVIFKLMCYYRVCIPWDSGWVDQPNPERIDTSLPNYGLPFRHADLPVPG